MKMPRGFYRTLRNARNSYHNDKNHLENAPLPIGKKKALQESVAFQKEALDRLNAQLRKARKRAAHSERKKDLGEVEVGLASLKEGRS